MAADALSAGSPGPLGASADANGINFAVFAPDAEKVELCLFDSPGGDERRRLTLPARTGDVHHGHLAGARAGQVYGLRAHGNYEPARGLRCNPAKLLLDPYAREVCGDYRWVDEHRPGERKPDARDNAAHMFRARVCETPAPVTSHPRIPWERTVIYELNVKGFTARHPQVPEALRGRFAALASEPVIEHLSRLGVTAVELLPVQAFVSEPFLAERGKVNYWGYNPLAWHAPHPAYGSAEAFRGAAEALHASGMEVLLDVVFNHTAEGGASGPLYHLKGLANAAYYRLTHGDLAQYVNDTGTGNTLNTHHPQVVAHIVDALRWWVQYLGVDGFRFDLASVLGRGEHGFRSDAPLFRALAADPVLSAVKLIAEPWDLGPDGYQLGAFPAPFAEWNGRFRDEVRDVWLTRRGNASSLAKRFTGSADVYRHGGRPPAASVNFITAHDGFTLADVVSYERKHNEANGEDNRDGHDDNRSWNAGHEGPSDDPAVRARRAALQRSLLATCLLAQGTPMLCAGDEIGRTQDGNNNAYCQDNALGWLDWEGADRALLDFAERTLAVRRDYPCLRRIEWLDRDDPDVGWFGEDGEPMTDAGWHHSPACLALELREVHGGQARTLRVLFNAGDHERSFALPEGDWRVLLDSAAQQLAGVPVPIALYTVGAHALALLERVDGEA